MEKDAGDWWTSWSSDPCLRDFLCAVAFQETDNWNVTGMKVLGSVRYGWDGGKTAILRLRQVSQVRKSWECHERCTAVLIDSVMMLSVYMPHGGYDEEKNYIAELEIVKIIMEEGKNGSQGLLFVGGDLNIELKLEGVNGNFRVLTALTVAVFVGLNVVEEVKIS